MHFEGRRPCLVLENNENRGQITPKIKGDGGSKILIPPSPFLRGPFSR